MNECENQQHDCDAEVSNCRNTDGSYYCDCITGYQARFNHETFMTEFLSKNFLKIRFLTRTRSSLNTSLKLVKVVTGSSECIDVDECEEKEYTCTFNSTCINTIGSYECECDSGYNKTDNQECLDIDECLITEPKVCSID